MTILLCDPRIAAINVSDAGEPLVTIDADLGPAEVRVRAGLVNYPTKWWHWSYGDRYWALRTGAPAALYGAVDLRQAA